METDLRAVRGCVSLESSLSTECIIYRDVVVWGRWVLITLVFNFVLAFHELIDICEQTENLNHRVYATSLRKTEVSWGLPAF